MKTKGILYHIFQRSEILMEIKRNLYLQRLINRIDNGMIKVITGIRRSGKSYLIFKIFKSYLRKLI